MIETANLKLIPFSSADAEAFAQGANEFAAHLGVRSLASDWNVFPEAVPYAFRYALEKNDEWGMYYFIHRKDNILIGNGGFKGAPNDEGAVEIGYALAEKYRGQGLATEAARGLTEFAFSFPFVKTVQAHTLAEKNASNCILQKIGMKFVCSLHDPEDGDLWQWRVTRQEYANQL